MKSLIIWHKEDRACFAAADSLPKSFSVQEENYNSLPVYFADFDYLKNANGELVGFYFIVDGSEPVLQSGLVQKSSNIILTPRELKIFFKEVQPAEIETVQGVGTVIFSNGEDFALGVPDWSEEADLSVLNPNDTEISFLS